MRESKHQRECACVREKVRDRRREQEREKAREFVHRRVHQFNTKQSDVHQEIMLAGVLMYVYFRVCLYAYMCVSERE